MKTKLYKHLNRTLEEVIYQGLWFDDFTYRIYKAFKRSGDFIEWQRVCRDSPNNYQNDFLGAYTRWLEKVQAHELECEFNSHEIIEMLQDEHHP